MKPSQLTEKTQPDLRRSSRTRVSAVKRKTEDEEDFEEVAKKIRKNDYFSIFDKRKPEISSQTKKRLGRPPKHKAPPEESDSNCEINKSEICQTPKRIGRPPKQKDQPDENDVNCEIKKSEICQTQKRIGRPPKHKNQPVEIDTNGEINKSGICQTQKRIGRPPKSKVQTEENNANCGTNKSEICQTQKQICKPPEPKSESPIEKDSFFSIFDKSKSRISRPSKPKSESPDDKDALFSIFDKSKSRISRPPKPKSESPDEKDALFSIFDKSKSRISPQPPKPNVRTKKQETEPLKSKNSLGNPDLKPAFTKTKERKKKRPKAVVSVDLIDDDESPPIDIETKVIPEYNFISSFLEDELPLTTLPNHMQLIDAKYEETILSDSKILLKEDLCSEVLISGFHSISSINCYYSERCNKKQAVCDTPTERQSDDHRMWVDKYKPKCAKDVAGHSTEVEVLASWLSEWKQKLKPTSSNSESSNSGFSFDASEEDGGILKCVALAGRCGRGKTSAVYAIARELGFKVFEVSPSSSRVGRHLLQQLQEATLSHHVQGIPKMSPLFRHFSKLGQTDWTGNPANTSADAKPSTPLNTKLKKSVKPKPGSITNFFIKTNSPTEVQETPTPKDETKVVKKTSLLNFFKPQCNKGDVSVVDEKALSDAGTANCNDEIIVTSVITSASQPEKVDTNSTDSVNEIHSRNTSDEDVTILDEVVSKPDDGQCTTVLNDEIRLERVIEDCVSEPTDNSFREVGKRKLSSKKRKVENGEINQAFDDKKDLEIEVVTKGEKSTECVSNPNDVSEFGLTPEMSKLKFCSLSVILFDDADICLDVDEGFWSTINSFLKVTRKPVVLTASQNVEELCDNINSEIELINFDNLHVASALGCLEDINEKEKLGLQSSDLVLLFEHCNQDIRQSLLQLQFWGKTKKEACSYAQIFGLPLPLICLDAHVSDNILKWLFEWNCLQAVELVFSCLTYNLNILHRNMNLWLPFKKIQREETKVVKKPVKKYRRLDTSLFSDDGSDDENSDSKSPVVDDRPAKPKDPHILPSLECMSQIYSRFSDADLIQKSALEFEDSFWQRNGPPLEKQPYNHDMATEIASWITLLSARQGQHKLQSLPDNEICIPADNSRKLNIVTQEASDKLVQCRQNIVNSALPLQRLNHLARCVDYFSLLRTVHKCEAARKECNTKRSRRFLHYFKASGFAVEKEDLLTLSNHAFCELF